jgi:hypothetical protein
MDKAKYASVTKPLEVNRAPNSNSRKVGIDLVGSARHKLVVQQKSSSGIERCPWVNMAVSVESFSYGKPRFNHLVLIEKVD